MQLVFGMAEAVITGRVWTCATLLPSLFSVYWLLTERIFSSPFVIIFIKKSLGLCMWPGVRAAILMEELTVTQSKTSKGKISQKCNIKHVNCLFTGVCSSASDNADFYYDVLRRMLEDVCQKDSNCATVGTGSAPWQHSCTCSLHNVSGFGDKQCNSHPASSILSRFSLLWLFPIPKMKLRPEWWCFNTVEEIHIKSQQVLDIVGGKDFQGTINLRCGESYGITI